MNNKNNIFNHTNFSQNIGSPKKYHVAVNANFLNVDSYFNYLIINEKIQVLKFTFCIHN